MELWTLPYYKNDGIIRGSNFILISSMEISLFQHYSIEDFPCNAIDE